MKSARFSTYFYHFKIFKMLTIKKIRVFGLESRDHPKYMTQIDQNEWSDSLTNVLSNPIRSFFGKSKSFQTLKNVRFTSCTLVDTVEPRMIESICEVRLGHRLTLYSNNPEFEIFEWPSSSTFTLIRMSESIKIKKAF